jgi:hypothetical protein
VGSLLFVGGTKVAHVVCPLIGSLFAGSTGQVQTCNQVSAWAACCCSQRQSGRVYCPLAQLAVGEWRENARYTLPMLLLCPAAASDDAGGLLITDSYSRKMMTRQLNSRPTWPLNIIKPVAGKYYLKIAAAVAAAAAAAAAAATELHIHHSLLLNTTFALLLLLLLLVLLLYRRSVLHRLQWQGDAD